jgi:hypothetical protein
MRKYAAVLSKMLHRTRCRIDDQAAPTKTKTAATDAGCPDTRQVRENMPT